MLKQTLILPEAVSYLFQTILNNIFRFKIINFVA